MPGRPRGECCDGREAAAAPHPVAGARERTVKQDDLAATIFVLAALAVMAIGFGARAGLAIPREIARLLGWLVFLAGMTLFTWAGLSLKGAFFGKVKPVTEQIVADGPYRWVRHPLYLSVIAALVGLCLMLRSWWGLLSVFALFLPAVIHRARLEERALGEQFGSAWQDYAARTAFLVPWVW